MLQTPTTRASSTWVCYAQFSRDPAPQADTIDEPALARTRR